MRQLAIGGVALAILAWTAPAAIADSDHWTNVRDLNCGGAVGTLTTALSPAGFGTPYHDLDSGRILVPLQVVVNGVTVLDNRGIEQNALSEVTCSYTDPPPASRSVEVTGLLTPVRP